MQQQQQQDNQCALGALTDDQALELLSLAKVGVQTSQRRVINEFRALRKEVAQQPDHQDTEDARQLLRRMGERAAELEHRMAMQEVQWRSLHTLEERVTSPQTAAEHVRDALDEVRARLLNARAGGDAANQDNPAPKPEVEGYAPSGTDNMFQLPTGEDLFDPELLEAHAVRNATLAREVHPVAAEVGYSFQVSGPPIMWLRSEGGEHAVVLKYPQFAAVIEALTVAKAAHEERVAPSVNSVGTHVAGAGVAGAFGSSRRSTPSFARGCYEGATRD